MDEYEKANKMGVNYDIRNDVYNQVENFDMDDLLTFHNSHMNNNARVVMILGSKEKIRFECFDEIWPNSGVDIRRYFRLLNNYLK